MADFSNLFKVEACQHELFPHEEDYMMCPNCGDIIWTNIPKGADFEQFFKQQKRVKRLFNQELEKKIVLTIAVILPLFTIFLNVVAVSFWNLDSKYGFTTFDTGHRGLPFIEIYAFSAVCFFIAISVLENFRQGLRERYPKHLLEERGYELVSSWKPWVKKLLFASIYYILVQSALYHFFRIVRYEDAMHIFNDTEISFNIANSYYQAGWIFFTFIFCINIFYLCFYCYRQRLVLKINETDYLSEK